MQKALLVQREEVDMTTNLQALLFKGAIGPVTRKDKSPVVAIRGRITVHCKNDLVQLLLAMCSFKTTNIINAIHGTWLFRFNSGSFLELFCLQGARTESGKLVQICVEL